tara:strand:- start:760 stop:990 length:231 start_codon:yes stop_codon:yes gene_type:complete
MVKPESLGYSIRTSFTAEKSNDVRSIVDPSIFLFFREEFAKVKEDEEEEALVRSTTSMIPSWDFFFLPLIVQNWFP